MWKYKCRSFFLSLLGAFAVGVLLTMFANGNDTFIELLDGSLPSEMVSVFSNNPILIYISGGFGIAGIMNVFLIGNLMSSFYSGSSFIMLILLLMFPNVALMIGVYTVPVVLIVTLYGWLSLKYKNRLSLKRANLSGDSEIVRIYLLHHPLLEQYKPLADEARKMVAKINLAYGLGLAAVFCVLFLVDNLWIGLIAVVFSMFAFQYLARLRAGSYSQISNLLYQQCDPEACLSALIYFGQRGGKYRIKNRPLFAQCLIYLNDPSLAQDVLIEFPRSSVNNELLYWSLMSYTYYLLKDESGLERCKEAMTQTKPAMGAMGLMVKSEELNSCINKIRLMQGDFNTCKKYYLELLKRSSLPLQKADCEYYIALISFVQEDYVLAKMYFEKVLQTGGRLYFVRNARNYLRKIEQNNNSDDNSQDENQTGTLLIEQK